MLVGKTYLDNGANKYITLSHRAVVTREIPIGPQPKKKKRSSTAHGPKEPLIANKNI